MTRIIFSLFLLVTQYIFAQSGARDFTPTQTERRPAYLDIAYGVHYATFRDFATSPLFYRGTPQYVALSHIDFDEKRESGIRASYAFGGLENNSSNAVSKVKIITVNYLELFELASMSSPDFNLKLGGQLNATANLRENKAFGNNSEGYEIISTLFASVKATKDLSRKKDNLKHNLALGFNLGLLNTSYRNGFIYTSQSPLLNQDGVGDAYEFRFFSGYRMNSSLDYTFWLKNGNAFQLSYFWDLYKTSSKRDHLEIATHLLKVSVLFNLK